MVPLIARAVTTEEARAEGLTPQVNVSDIALEAPSGLAPEQPTPEEIKNIEHPITATTTLRIKQMVADEFPDAPIMVHIADSESQFIPWADNPNSTAYGVFQILSGTWKDYGCEGDRGDPEDNIACARIIYDADGTSPWNASKHKWGIYVTI